MIAADVGEYKIDVVRDALENTYPKYFGNANKTCIVIDEKAAFILKAVASNENLDISDVIFRGLETSFPQYITQNELV